MWGRKTPYGEDFVTLQTCTQKLKGVAGVTSPVDQCSPVRKPRVEHFCRYCLSVLKTGVMCVWWGVDLTVKPHAHWLMTSE